MPAVHFLHCPALIMIGTGLRRLLVYPRCPTTAARQCGPSSLRSKDEPAAARPMSAIADNISLTSKSSHLGVESGLVGTFFREDCHESTPRFGFCLQHPSYDWSSFLRPTCAVVLRCPE